MTCFASVFARKTLGVEQEHPELVRLLNVPLAAELFFASYWKSQFNTDVTMATSARQVGWDFKTSQHKVEVKTCVGQLVGNSFKFQITKLQHKTGSYLCSLFDSPDNKYCMIGFAIPPSVWLPLMTDGGRITLTVSTDYKVITNRPELSEFLKYHTLYDKTSLSMLFDRTTQ